MSIIEILLNEKEESTRRIKDVVLKKYFLSS